MKDAVASLAADKPRVAVTKAARSTVLVKNSAHIGIWRAVKIGGSLLLVVVLCWLLRRFAKRRRVKRAAALNVALEVVVPPPAQQAVTGVRRPLTGDR